MEPSAAETGTVRIGWRTLLEGEPRLGPAPELVPSGPGDLVVDRHCNGETWRPVQGDGRLFEVEGAHANIFPQPNMNIPASRASAGFLP